MYIMDFVSTVSHVKLLNFEHPLFQKSTLMITAVGRAIEQPLEFAARDSNRPVGSIIAPAYSLNWFQSL